MASKTKQQLATALLTAAIEASRDQLRAAYERRDITAPAAEVIRYQLLALQTVEINLTRAISEAQNGDERTVPGRHAGSRGDGAGPAAGGDASTG